MLPYAQSSFQLLYLSGSSEPTSEPITMTSDFASAAHAVLKGTASAPAPVSGSDAATPCRKRLRECATCGLRGMHPPRMTTCVVAGDTTPKEMRLQPTRRAQALEAKREQRLELVQALLKRLALVVGRAL